jgi:hypothetical protein
MSRFRWMVAFLFLSLSAGLAQADGLLYQLPKDGAWVSYDFNATAKAEGHEMKVKGALCMASVGQVTEADQPCRWIEIQVDMSFDEGDRQHKKSEVYKLLIPEKYLAKGESPLEHVIRAWFKRGESETKKMENLDDADASPLPIVLAGPWKDAKTLDKAEVDCKLGKLLCEGVQSSREFKLRREGVLKCMQEVRLHPDAPFGVVGGRWVIDAPRAPNMEWTLKLKDVGEKAESKIPDAK